MAKKRLKINGVRTKLTLYVTAAVLGAVIADLIHYSQAVQSTIAYQSISQIPQIKLIILVLNAAVQGIVAWRAFVDDACQECEDEMYAEQEEEKNRLSILENQLVQLKHQENKNE